MKRVVLRGTRFINFYIMKEIKIFLKWKPKNDLLTGINNK